MNDGLNQNEFLKNEELSEKMKLHYQQWIKARDEKFEKIQEELKKENFVTIEKPDITDKMWIYKQSIDLKVKDKIYIMKYTINIFETMKPENFMDEYNKSVWEKQNDLKSYPQYVKIFIVNYLKEWTKLGFFQESALNECVGLQIPGEIISKALVYYKYYEQFPECPVVIFLYLD